MASLINEVNSAGPVQKNSPTQVESDNSARSRTVMSMLSGFANDCMTEWGFYPGMTQDMENLKVENAALRSENAALKKEHALMQGNIKKLWQDNEILDRSLKHAGPERDFFKDRAERYHYMLSINPDSLPAVCHNLEQEVERLRRQYAALTSTTERLVNDGLALGVLSKSEPSPDDSSLNVHYKRPQLITTQARVPHSNVPQHMNGNLNAHAPSQISPVLQQPVYISSQSQQPSPTLPIHHQSYNSVHISSQIASQPQSMVHRIPNNRLVNVVTPVDQRRHSLPPVERVADTSTSPQSLHQSNMIPHNPLHLHLHTNARPHSHPQLQSRSQPSSMTPSTSPNLSAHSQRSASLPHPHSQVQMVPQSRSAPVENQLSIPQHSIPSNSQVMHSFVQTSPLTPTAQNMPDIRVPTNIYPPAGPSMLSQQASASPLSPSSVTHNVPLSAPSSSGELMSAPVQEARIINKKPIQGSAPPTPPQSDKSLSPEQEQYSTLPPPIPIRQTLKRAGKDEGIPESSSKRMRLDVTETVTEPIQSMLPPSEAATVARTAEFMVQDTIGSSQTEIGDVIVKSSDLQAARPSAKAQTLEPAAEDVVTTVQDELASTSVTFASAQLRVENVDDNITKATESIYIDKPTGPVILAEENGQNEIHAEAEGSEEDGEDGEDEDEESCSEKEALEEVLKIEQSRSICTLCRARHERYPDKYTDAIFDLDTPTPVLVGHFITIHPAVWSRLRGAA
ncbi:hypothetical protein F5890DRAFT_944914 [Lentinula detonsa]|uniref:Uncharacterized protein n=1 Tax=Lentinula detonsa TaxID=2804962 RepID=A0AA38UTW7_9AGAR|nr:hypothetical protein F5890DRAFT_944914 [Lentinula detonsa]